MKNKKLFLPILIIVIAVVVSAGFGVLSGVVKHPLTKEAEFPFSITYKYNSETITINEQYVCEFVGADAETFSQIRFWNGYIKGYENSNDYIVSETESGTLYICPNIYADYVMGDPLASDYYSEDWPYQPYAMFYGADGIEYTDAETIAAQGIEIVSWDYPQPIENEFVFAYITTLSGDSVVPLALIAVIAFVVCIIFVKRTKGAEFRVIDKISVVLNFVIGIVIIPFITVISVLTDINGDGADMICQIMYCIPAFSVLCLALSLSLRRKGFSKSGIVVQFIGPLVFALLLFCF